MIDPACLPAVVKVGGSEMLRVLLLGSTLQCAMMVSAQTVSKHPDKVDIDSYFKPKDCEKTAKVVIEVGGGGGGACLLDQ